MMADNWTVLSEENSESRYQFSASSALLHQFLEERARHAPEKTAVVCGAERRSYGEMELAATRLARAFLELGIAKGDRIAICLENSIETVIAIFAALKAGAVFSTVQPSITAEKLAFVLADERASALITSNDRLRRHTAAEALVNAAVPTVVWVGGMPSATAPAGTRFHDWGAMLAASNDDPVHCNVVDTDLGAILYTSGTTGAPKGVVSAHRDMVFAVRSITTYLENTVEDVIFCSLSLAFSYGLYQLLTAVYVGATLVLEKNFVFPQKALQIMSRERVTGLPGVPTTFALLLGLNNLADYDLGALRYVTNAAAPLPVRHVGQLQAKFPQARFFSMYGQTECKRTCYLPPEELQRRPDSVGIPIPGTSVQVVDEQGRPVQTGGVGELVVQGPHLMRGYWERPEETAARLRPALDSGQMVLYTGDLFRMDDEGFLYFVSRKDDIIKSRGEKVSPNEVEHVLLGLNGVRDVAVVGIPDDILGEAIKAFVVVQDGALLTERDIRAHCAHRLQDFMTPKYVEFRAALPRSNNGKIIRKALRACVA